MLTFDPIEDKGWPLRAGYKVEILAAIEGQGATSPDQQSDDYGAEIERFFRELTYEKPFGPAGDGAPDTIPLENSP